MCTKVTVIVVNLFAFIYHLPDVPTMHSTFIHDHVINNYHKTSYNVPIIA